MNSSPGFFYYNYMDKFKKLQLINNMLIKNKENAYTIEELDYDNYDEDELILISAISQSLSNIKQFLLKYKQLLIN